MFFKMINSEISVIIPSYNCEKYIERAINSAMIQSLVPKEIIIVDDGSTDNTRALVENLQKRTSTQLTYLYKENGGLSSARNFGIKNSSTSLLAFLDSDDEWHSEKLQMQFELLASQNETGNLGVVYCDCELIDEFGKKMFAPRSTYIDVSLKGSIFNQLLEANRVAGSGSGVLVKKECFDKVGLFDEKLTAAEDWDMWLRIAEYYSFDFVDKILVKIRRHKGNMQGDAERMFKNELSLMVNWARKLEVESIPKSWPHKITEYIVQQLPRTKGLVEIFQNIPRDVEIKLFYGDQGSIRAAIMYKLAYRVYRQLRNCAKSFLVNLYNLLNGVILCSVSFLPIYTTNRKNE